MAKSFFEEFLIQYALIKGKACYSLCSTHGGESMCTDSSKRETTKKPEIKKKKKKQKSFVDHDWKKLQKRGKLHSLVKPELQHYLKHYKLSCNGRNDDWVQRILSHLLLSGVVDQAGVLTPSAISDSSTNYGKWQRRRRC